MPCSAHTSATWPGSIATGDGSLGSVMGVPNAATIASNCGGPPLEPVTLSKRASSEST